MAVNIKQVIIELEDGCELKLSYDEARALRDKLVELFGKDTNYPYPIYVRPWCERPWCDRKIYFTNSTDPNAGWPH